MSTSTRPHRAPLSTVAVLALLLLTFIAVTTSATTADAAAPEDGGGEGDVGHGVLPVPERIAGADRYAQSVAAVQAMGLESAELVYVASGETFPDALSAASIAGVRGAPLLLTARTSLPPVVAAELARLAPSAMVIVGGEAAVSDDVALQLSRLGTGTTVVRVGGADRYEVSRQLIADAAVGAAGAHRLVLATGVDFPDALSAAPAAAMLSASGTSPMPVLLVDGHRTEPTSTERALVADLRVTAALIVGGTASVSGGFERNLAATTAVTVARSAGADRFDNAVEINRRAFPVTSGGPGSNPVAYLASGTSFPDALSGAPLAAAHRAPLFLVRPTCVPTVVLAELARRDVGRIVLLGGTAALTPAVAVLTPCP